MAASNDYVEDNVFRFKGYVDYIDLLPTGDKVEEGDMYQVRLQGHSKDKSQHVINTIYVYDHHKWVGFVAESCLFDRY